MTQSDVAELEQSSGPCRHCGETIQYDLERGDTRCPHCERFQNTVQCPTCRQPVDIHVLPEMTAKEED